jgi:galactosylceramidase
MTLLRLSRSAGDRRFDGVGAVNGGGATSVLLKDYPEPQRSQILDLVFRPKFGASVSTMLVEIPGDGNATQGSMPSHMHTRDDLDGERGYTWWILAEATARNPEIALDATAWSAPGWLGGGEFWSDDTVEYYLAWLRILRDRYGLRLSAIGCRNEKGVSLDFAKALRHGLDEAGFADVLLHGFDHWPDDKFDFVHELVDDADARDAIDVIGAHVMYGKPDAHTPPEVRELADAWGKPIWNTEDHVYRSGFDCLIGIVECVNDNIILSGATKIVLWYDIAGVYPVEPYPEDPTMIVAHEPWSGHYRVREALWGYAHYGQFTEAGWNCLAGACRQLPGGGSVVTLASEGGDVSAIVETSGAVDPQKLRFELGGFDTTRLHVWRSTAEEQFVEQPPLTGDFEIELLPNAVYSITTTTGQRKGSFGGVPAPAAFPLPYRDDFASYEDPASRGYLPRYTADIAGAFELVRGDDGRVRLQQAVPIPTLSWAPDWRPYTIIGDENWHDVRVETRVVLEEGDTGGIMARVNHVGTGYGFVPKGYVLDISANGEWSLLSINGKADKTALVGDAEQQAIIRTQHDTTPGGEHVLARGTVALRSDARLPQVAGSRARSAAVLDAADARGISADPRANAAHPSETCGVREADRPPAAGARATLAPDPSAGSAPRVASLALVCEGSRIRAYIDGAVVAAVDVETHARGMAGLIAGQSETRVSRPAFEYIDVRAPGHHQDP